MQVIHDLDVAPGRFDNVFFGISNWVQVDQDQGFKPGDWVVMNHMTEEGVKEVGQIDFVESLPDGSVLVTFKEMPCYPVQTERGSSV